MCSKLRIRNIWIVIIVYIPKRDGLKMIRKEHIKQSHEIKHDGTECFQCGKELGRFWRVDLGLFENMKFKKLYHLESGESMPCFCSLSCKSKWCDSNLRNNSSSGFTQNQLLGGILMSVSMIGMAISLLFLGLLFIFLIWFFFWYFYVAFFFLNSSKAFIISGFFAISIMNWTVLFIHFPFSGEVVRYK